MAATVGTPWAAVSGDWRRVVPVRETATIGDAETVGLKDGLEHLCIYLGAVSTGDTYLSGSPVRSAAFATSSITTTRARWDPDDATGTITFAASGASTGWLHLWRYPGVTSGTVAGTGCNVGTPYAALNGNPRRVIPIRNTATLGAPQDVAPKEGYQHYCVYLSSVANGNTHDFGKPIRSAAFAPVEAETQLIYWDPDDANGQVSFTLTGGTSGYLHVWSVE